MAEEEPDCRTCGACCAPNFFTVVSLPLERDDVVPMRWIPHIEEDKLGNKTITFDTDGDLPQCPYLEGEMGVRVTCSIYDRRPRVCSEFPAGSPCCTTMREKSGVAIAV